MRDPAYPPGSNLYILFFLTIVVLGGAMLLTCYKAEPEPDYIVLTDEIELDDPNDSNEGYKFFEEMPIITIIAPEGESMTCKIETFQLLNCR